jgi:N-acetylneuraminate synthase
LKINKVTIIAEAGVNHNGDIRLAKRLVDIAKDSGADYIKFQAFFSKELVTSKSKLAKYQEKNLRKKKIKQFDLLKKLELKKEDYISIINYCNKKKIKYLFSVFDMNSLNLLLSLGITEIKIPSGEVDNYPLLKLIAEKIRRVFVSTGMCSLEDVEATIKILKKYGLKKNNIVIMHCNTDYPTKIKDVNLLAMVAMGIKFKIGIGYSDHTEGFETAIAAVALGAKTIEKHITTNKRLKGPDHAASMEPLVFKNYVKLIRNTSLLLGVSKKTPTIPEKINMKLVKKSIVANQDIKKGDIFSEKNLSCKRPALGISPYHWKSVLGKKAKKDYKVDDFIIL